MQRVSLARVLKSACEHSPVLFAGGRTESSCSIDTGIDYNHPVLGKGFGTGYKVAGGYDFVGDNFDGSNTPQPDNDPLDTCAGHGTHVAVRRAPMRFSNHQPMFLLF